MKIEAVIFDLDDTLYPQAEYVKQSLLSTVDFLSQVLKVKDKELIGDLLINKFKEKGIDYPVLFNDVLENYFNVSDSYIVNKAVEIYRNYRPRKVRLFSGAKCLLERLSKDYKLGLITDGRPFRQRYKLRLLGIKIFFNAIIYCDKYGIENRKPSLLPYLKAVDCLGVSPRNCVYVGNDPRKDFVSAKDLGMKTIRVLYGEFKNLRVGQRYEADKRIKTILEVEPTILNLQDEDRGV